MQHPGTCNTLNLNLYNSLLHNSILLIYIKNEFELSNTISEFLIFFVIGVEVVKLFNRIINLESLDHRKRILLS